MHCLVAALVVLFPTIAGAAPEGGVILHNAGPAIFLLATAVTLVVSMIFRPVWAAATRSLSDKYADRRLQRLLAGNGRPTLCDFIVPGACGGLVRIDYAVMTGRGIVCVMHRRYAGAIGGGPADAQWVAVANGSQRRFLNPVAQNQTHVEALKKVLPGVPVAGLVVFDQAARFATERPDGVARPQEVLRAIDELDFGTLSFENPDDAWLTLRSRALTDDASRKDLDAQLSFG